MKRIGQFCSTLLMLNTLSAIGASQCNIHTWHNIHAKNGEWKITFKTINESGYFVDANCNSVETGAARLNEPLKYGFGFSSGSTFDIAYTVTAIKESDHGFESPACVFVVTASGPAQPDVNALSYNGAVCEWKKVARAGGDIYLS